MNRRTAIALGVVQMIAAGALLFLGYVVSFTRPHLGISWRDDGTVIDVLPGGSGMRAGIRLGDRLLAINGVAPSEGIPALHFVRAGDAVVADLNGRGHRRVTIIPETAEEARRRALRTGGSHAVWAVSSYAYMPLNLWMLALGVALFALRPQVAAARVAGLAFAAWSAGNWLAHSSAVGAILSPLPPALRLLVYAADAFAIGAFFAFCLQFALIFPKPLRAEARHPLIRFVPFLAGLPIATEAFLQALRTTSPWFRARIPNLAGQPMYSIVAPLVLGGAILILVGRFRSTTGVTDRRRLRLVFAAIVPGALTMTVLIALTVLNAPVAARNAANLAQAAGVVAGSAIFTYAVVRHRLFDIRLLVRRSLQYALARGTLGAAMFIPAAAMALFLYEHRERSLNDLLRGRPLIYLALVAGFVMMLRYRRRLLDALDRRYFRERYDARQLLLHLVSLIQRGSDTSSLTSAAVAQIDKALHPQHMSLWLLDHAGSSYRREIAAGEQRGGSQLAASAAIVTLLATDEEPLDMTDRARHALRRRLPEGEREWVDAADAHLLVPLLIEHRLVGFLLLGGRLSEEPYSTEDRKLLRTIAAQLSVTIDYTRLKSSPSLVWSAAAARPDTIEEEAKLCPKCRRCFPTASSTCPVDGSRLDPEEGVPFVIENKYELQRLIGRGGMGSVYLATQRRLHRPVAVKILLGHLISSPTMRSRFEREARVVARLRHPAIVTVHDFGTLHSTHAYLVMEYLEGRTLRERIERGPVPLDETIEILTPVANAIDVAHGAGIVHRDLKPENIMLLRHGAPGGPDPKILDFGLAKLSTQNAGTDSTALQTTQSGSIIGTLPYMAPELFSGSPADARSDLYSLGIIAYEMLAGTHPFEARDLGAIVFAHTQLPVPPIARWNPAVPVAADSAVQRALEKQADARFASASEFISALAA